MKLSPEDQAKRDAAIRAREIQGDRMASEAAIMRLPKGDLLLGYQQRTVDLLFAGTALLVIEKSRRIGLTWGVASFAALKAASSVAAGGSNVWYMGYDKDMTLEFIEVCAMWARAFGLIAGELQEEEVLYVDENGKEQGVKAFSIRFASGFRVTALPSVPRALRGKQGVVIIDEAAFHKNVNEVIKSAMALLIWGGKIRVISTHNGTLNPFNELVREARAGKVPFKVHFIPFSEAVKNGLFRRVCLMRGLTWSPEAEAAWEAKIRGAYGARTAQMRQELDAIPADAEGAALPRVVIEQVIDRAIPVIRYRLPDSFKAADKAVREGLVAEWCQHELLPHL